MESVSSEQSNGRKQSSVKHDDACDLVPEIQGPKRLSIDCQSSQVSSHIHISIDFLLFLCWFSSVSFYVYFFQHIMYVSSVHMKHIVKN